VPNDRLPYFYRGAALYVLTDVIAACPNSVIEALACGTPVVGYDSSVLPEMLDRLAGRWVRPQGDPWRGERPGNIGGLVEAALEIVRDNAAFRAGARRLAESRYDLNRMIEEYLDFLVRY
jgi:glycosyltransferase involved in cell wall biosynthesis